MDNCDIWSEVDFGEGTVRVRCTEFGPHTKHVCHVDIQVETAPVVDHDSLHNVFDEDDITPSNVRPAHKPPYNFLQ